jgi:hypothetical protein
MTKKLLDVPGFAGVEDGGVRIEPGEYLMQCTDVEERDSITSGTPMFVFTFIGREGEAKGKRFQLYCSFADAALWRLKSTFRAFGLKTPADPSKLDPDDVIDVEVVGIVEDHTYNGSTFSRVVAVLENHKKLPKLGESEIRDMDPNELKAVVRKYDLDVDLSEYKTDRRKIDAVLDALDEAGLLED